MSNELKNINVSSIKPHPQNDKIYDTKGKVFQDGIESLKQSISKLGLLEPLVLNKKNVLLSGHRRFTAIKELGIKKLWKKISGSAHSKRLKHNNRRMVQLNIVCSWMTDSA